MHAVEEKITEWYLRAANAFEDLKDDIAGQGLVEYALILALVAIVAVGLLLTVGGDVKNVFTHISNCLNNPANNSNTC
ncbi:MAG TPA: Flp family type IVb pilin [Chloroflexota bacterium]|nr:Flp family type IVb pilin [Chloroflexota bacterium]